MLTEVYIDEIWSNKKININKYNKKNVPYMMSDLEYLCKYWEVDEPDLIALALDRSVDSVKTKVSELKRLGLYNTYRTLNKYW